MDWDSPGGLSVDEVRRYSRHLVLPEVGLAGQLKLRRAKVLVVGAGGLGSPVVLYLAAAGVGHVGIADGDVVDLSNLQRQVVHGTSRAGWRKTVSARERLQDLNPHVSVTCHDERLTRDNALEVIEQYDVVVDGTDGFAARYLLNDACVFLSRPLVHGSVLRFEGQVTVFKPGEGPCYRCLYPEPPPPWLTPSCSDAGVLGVLPGLVGMIQAAEVLKLVLELGDVLCGRLLLVDVAAMSFLEVRIPRNPDCAVCGATPSITELIDYEEFCSGGEPLLPDSPEVEALAVSPEEVQRMMEQGPGVLLLDVRSTGERALAELEGALAIPLTELMRRMREVPRDRPIVVCCHEGERSRQAVVLLKSAGFPDVWWMAGGLDAWAARIDPSMIRY